MSRDEPPQRPTIPLSGRGSKRSQPLDDFAEEPDEGATMWDPNVPTGARVGTDDERRTNQGPAQADPFSDLDANDKPTGATMVGKRSAVPGAPKLAGPRPEDVTVPTKRKRPPIESDERVRSRVDVAPPGIDESARTKRWDPPPLVADAEPTGPALRPPPGPTQPPPIPQQYPIPPVLPLPPAPRSEPIHVMSMKAPADLEAERQHQRAVPEVRVRAMAEVRQQQSQTPPRGMGNLAPPRDPREARSRKRTDIIIWGSVAFIVAAVVMLAVWFLAR